MGSMFKPATRKKLFARIALDGPPGSGKTYTGLLFLFALKQLRNRKRVAVIDTEFRSASKYQGEEHEGQIWNFDSCELAHYDPTNYVVAIQEAERAGYDALFIDSLSHAWAGVGGALEQVGKSTSANTYVAWKDVTPKQEALTQAMHAFQGDLIVSMRTKMEYVLEEQVNKQGKTVQVPKKVGMKPIQREGLEYEFDIVCDLTLDHELIVSKSRCSAIDGMRIIKPSGTFLNPVARWLDSGTEPQLAPQFNSSSNGNGEHSTATDSAPAEPPPFTPSGPAAGESIDVNGKCLSHQVEAMQLLAKELIEAGVTTKEKVKAQLAERGYAKLADMTVAEADQLIAKMRQKASEAQAAARF